jgi:hypothetical protein
MILTPLLKTRLIRLPRWQSSKAGSEILPRNLRPNAPAIALLASSILSLKPAYSQRSSAIRSAPTLGAPQKSRLKAALENLADGNIRQRKIQLLSTVGSAEAAGSGSLAASVACGAGVSSAEAALSDASGTGAGAGVSAAGAGAGAGVSAAGAGAGGGVGAASSF